MSESTLILYHLTRVDGCPDYDICYEMVVAALSEDDAKIIQPNGGDYNPEPHGYDNDWVTPNKVIVKRIGVADKDVERGVISACWNNG